MNAQKFTQKSLEAIQNAQEITIEHQNMQMDQEHLLYALLTQEQGLTAQLLTKMGVNTEALTQEVKRAVESFPHVSGPVSYTHLDVYKRQIIR